MFNQPPPISGESKEDSNLGDGRFEPHFSITDEQHCAVLSTALRDGTGVL